MEHQVSHGRASGRLRLANRATGNRLTMALPDSVPLEMIMLSIITRSSQTRSNMVASDRHRNPSMQCKLLSGQSRLIPPATVRKPKKLAGDDGVRSTLPAS